MSDLVTVYTANHDAEAQMLREELEANEIPVYLDQTPSPLDGLSVIDQGVPIMVSSDHAQKAREIIEGFLGGPTEEEQR